MKAAFAIGAATALFFVTLGCGNATTVSGGGRADNRTVLAGTWSCLTKSRDAAAGLTDDKTFSADGWHSSSKFPEGKKYAYRLDGFKLIVSYPTGDWTGNVIRLTATSLEYYSGKPGQLTDVTCQKKS